MIHEVTGRDVFFTGESNGQVISVQGQSKEAGASIVLPGHDGFTYRQWQVSKA